MLHANSEKGQASLDTIIIIAVVFGVVTVFCKYVLPMIFGAIWGNCTNIAC